jgi:hypothetical protein
MKRDVVKNGALVIAFGDRTYFKTAHWRPDGAELAIEKCGLVHD